MLNGVPVIGFVGPSSTGKTSLLEGVVRELQQRALEIGVVKHSCHAVEADKPGKDSARLYSAGAEAVVLAGSNQIVTFVRRETPPRLADTLIALPLGLDAILVEGFSWEPIPRYLVLPKGFEQLERYSQGPVLGTIHPEPRVHEGDPLFLPHVVRSLASEIEAHATRPPFDRPDRAPTR